MKNVGIFIILIVLAVAVLIACKYVPYDNGNAPKKNETFCVECGKEVTDAQSICNDCKQKEQITEQQKEEKEFIKKKKCSLAKELKIDKQSCTKNYFAQIDTICQEILEHNGELVKSSKIYSFAQEYNKWQKSKITVELKNIQFKKDPQAKDIVQLNYCHLQTAKNNGNKPVYFYKAATNNDNSVLVMSNITILPTETPVLDIEWSRYGRGKQKSAIFDKSAFQFNPHKQTEFDCSLHGFEYVKVRCSVIIGETFPDFLKRVLGTNKPDISVFKESKK